MKRDFKKRLSQLFSNMDLIWVLSKKELRAKYSGSRLGIWWALILPLLLAFSINLIFTKAFKVSIPNYSLFILSAIFPWIFFSQGLSESANSFFNNSSILRQGVFPREIIPVASIVGNFLNFIIGLGVIVPLFILFNFKAFFFIPALLLVIVLFLIFLLGLGFVFSSINVFYRDVSCFLSVGLMIWFWITPIFYSIEMLPYPYRIICIINPLTYFVLNFRDLLYYGRASLGAISITAFFSLSFFFIGYHIFLCKESELLKRL